MAILYALSSTLVREKTRFRGSLIGLIEHDNLRSMPESQKRLFGIIDAATVLAATTAVLYFWGYAYFITFCSDLQFSFNGIEVPTQDYLVTGWYSALNALKVVVILVLALGVSLCAFDLIWRKEDPAPKSETGRATVEGFGFIKLGLLLLYVMLLVSTGGLEVIRNAKRDAIAVVQHPRLAIVRDKSGSPFPGAFLFLRDFGGALAVAELSVDGKDWTGIRVIMKGSYTSYSLPPLPSGAPEIPRPTAVVPGCKREHCACVTGCSKRELQSEPSPMQPGLIFTGLGAIGTWVACLVALGIALMPQLWKWLKRPSLSVLFPRIEEFSSEIGNAYWLRVPIANAAGKMEARNVEAYLENFEEVTGDGPQRIDGMVAMRMKWSNTDLPCCSSIPSGGFRLLDIGRVEKDAIANIAGGLASIDFPTLTLGGEIAVPAHAPLRFGTYRLSITISAQEMPPKSLKLDIMIRPAKSKDGPLARVARAD